MPWLKNCSLRTVFKVLCISATIILTSVCIWKFDKDDSISSVKFQYFHEDINSIYPSVSLCFGRPVEKEKLKTISKLVAAQYPNFLKGILYDKYMDKRIHNISYENATINVSDYLTRISMGLKNGSRFNYLHGRKSSVMRNHYSTDMNSTWSPVFYMETIVPEEKCFTFDITYFPNKPIKYFGFALKPELLQICCKRGTNTGFKIRLSYPHHVRRSGFSEKLLPILFNDDQNKQINLHLVVKRMEIIKYRNEKYMKCYENEFRDDMELDVALMEKVGCRPPNFKFNQKFPNCTSQEEMKKVIELMSDIHETPPGTSKDYLSPCQQISSLDYDVEKKLRNLGAFTKGLVVIIKKFPGRFTEFKQVKDYNLESLIGNAGGYIGMFLGFSILQLADLLSFFYNVIKGIYANKCSTGN